MLLRRITENLRQQNWVAVGLDLVVVVLGVFLAFQVNEWKEDRQNRADELVAIARLQDEASEIVGHLLRLVNSFEELGASQDFAVAALSEKSWEAVDREQIETGIGTMVMYPAVSLPRSTYDELLGSGRFGAITHSTIRKAVSEYYSELDFVQSQLVFFRQFAQGSEQVAGDGLALVYDPASKLRLKMEFDLEALANNRLYMSNLVQELRNQRMFQYYRRGLLGRAAEMCQALADVTGSPCPPVDLADTR